MKPIDEAIASLKDASQKLRAAGVELSQGDRPIERAQNCFNHVREIDEKAAQIVNLNKLIDKESSDTKGA